MNSRTALATENEKLALTFNLINDMLQTVEPHNATRVQNDETFLVHQSIGNIPTENLQETQNAINELHFTTTPHRSITTTKMMSTITQQQQHKLCCNSNTNHFTL